MFPTLSNDKAFCTYSRTPNEDGAYSVLDFYYVPVLCTTYFDLVPILAGEWVLCLLLETLLSLRKAFVPVAVVRLNNFRNVILLWCAIPCSHSGRLRQPLVLDRNSVTYFPTAILAMIFALMTVAEIGWWKLKGSGSRDQRFRCPKWFVGEWGLCRLAGCNWISGPLPRSTNVSLGLVRKTTTLAYSS